MNRTLNRRSFMKASPLAAGASALEVRPLSAAENNPALKSGPKVKLGWVGCGGRGGWSARLFQRHGGYEIHAVADRFQTAAGQCGDEPGVDRPRRFSTLSGCLMSPQQLCFLRRLWLALGRKLVAAGVVLAVVFGFAGADAGQLPNPFFAMDTGTQDATHKTPAEQVALVKAIGFAGVGPIYHNLAELQAWCAALDQNGLKLFALYVHLPLDDASASLDSIREIAAALRGRDTLLWLYVTDKAGTPSGTNDDAVAVNTLRELAGVAQAAGLRVALYPHTGFYVQRVEDAVRLAQKVNRENLGVTFNLCHWLKVDGKNLEASLAAAQPHLFCVTINGADTGGTSWKELIQPLDRGTFDVSQLLRLLRRMKYAGPIGLQHYGIGGDAADNLRHSMEGWKKLSAAVLANQPSI